MYVAHDAFNRDLTRLLAAAEAGAGHSPAAEDASHCLRPREVVSNCTEKQILDDVEREHASVDLRLRRMDASVAARDDVALTEALTALDQGLPEHTRRPEGLR